MKIICSDEMNGGIGIQLDGNELALAVMDYVESQGIRLIGPRTIKVNDQLCRGAEIYVDPAGTIRTATGLTILGADHASLPINRNSDPQQTEQRGQ